MALILEKKAMADIGRPVGRPPLQVRKLTVRLPAATLDRIKARVGEFRIAEFLREAAERELARRDEEDREA